jgi:hypothetical protein
MQHDYLEHQWGRGTIPDWVNDAFDEFNMWFSVGNMHRQLGIRTKNGVEFVEEGDWIVANIDGTYGVRHG